MLKYSVHMRQRGFDVPCWVGISGLGFWVSWMVGAMGTGDDVKDGDGGEGNGPGSGR